MTIQEMGQGQHALYYAADSRLTALHPINGEQFWQQEITTLPFGAQILCFMDDVLYLGSWKGSVVAVDVRTRHTLWQYDGNEASNLYEMAVCRNTLALQFNGHTLNVLHALTGRLLWTYADASSSIWQIKLTINAVYLFGGEKERSSSNFILALDLTGKVLWRVAHRELITVTDEIIYVAENIPGYLSFRLHALQPENGNEVWATDLIHVNSYVSSKSVIDNVLYVVTSDHLLAINTRNGKQLWSREYVPLLSPDRGHSITLLADQDHLFTMQRTVEESHDDGDECMYRLWSLDRATGKALWCVREGADIVLTSANQDVIFFSGALYRWWNGFLLFAISKKDGRKLWSVRMHDQYFRTMTCT